MNIHVGVYVRYSGVTDGLRPLLEKIGNALIEEGFGCDPGKDIAKSLIVVEESTIGEYTEAKDFVESIIRNSMMVIVPTVEEEDGSASN